MIKNKIRAFLRDLKHWMTCNFLKLSESKTNVIEILSNRNIESRIISNVQIDDSCSLPIPNDYVKILGVIFDDRLNLEKHINRVVCTCYANLHNLGRIASKLTKPLKVQLVHSLILSHIDYCNALFYNFRYQNIYCTSWQKFYILQWYSVVRFIFGLRGSALHMHMLPYLKSLHFLPVKFHIEFKIALVTHKCLQGYAPTYLKNLINSRSVLERYSLHVNDDNWLLQTVTSLNFARSQSMFSCASPKVWNSLPLSLRENETLSLFKKRLEAYYFNLAFEDITIVWCQNFAAYCCRIGTSVVY